jgi:anti-sigma factor RsiW
MKCEDLQLNLSTYLDDILTTEERATIDEHLAQCPLCRQKLADFQLLRVSLRSLARPALPNERLVSMRNRIALEAKSPERKFWFASSAEFTEWLQMRVMPYGIGTAFSLILGLTLLWSMLSATYIPNNDRELAKFQQPTKPTVLVTNSAMRQSATENDFDLNAADYASARLTVSGGSPSLNPQGALVALTKSIMRGNMKDDEIVVVADVFGDGLAQIAEVVEPSKDLRAVSELEKALKNDPNFAPFVPASFDRRSETVRVIFKINRVDIKTNTKPKSDGK